MPETFEDRIRQIVREELRAFLLAAGLGRRKDVLAKCAFCAAGPAVPCEHLDNQSTTR